MNKVIALMLTVFIACPALSFAGEGGSTGGSVVEETTVKSGKSNSSDRSSTNAGGSAAQGTTVKSSKSNSSERSGGNTAEGTTVKGSKSNSDN